MRTILSFALLAGSTLFACQNKNTTHQEQADSTSNMIQNRVPQDTLTFSYDSVKVYAKQPLSSDDRVTDTAKAVLTYPVFQNASLNKYLESKVASMSSFGETSYGNNYKEVVATFIKGFDDFKAGERETIQTWFLDGEVTVLKQFPGYVPLKYTWINFSGGAHPNSMRLYINYDLNTGKEIILDSLLVPGGMAKLNAVAEKIFRQNEKLAPDASLKNDYFFTNDKFNLNQNFTITKDGLKFLYNPYEIKAYAYGITELVIPYSQIKEILKPNTIISTIN